MANLVLLLLAYQHMLFRSCLDLGHILEIHPFRSSSEGLLPKVAVILKEVPQYCVWLPAVVRCDAFLANQMQFSPKLMIHGTISVQGRHRAPRAADLLEIHILQLPPIEFAFAGLVELMRHEQIYERLG